MSSTLLVPYISSLFYTTPPPSILSRLLVERVEQLDANKVHVTGTAHEDDQRHLSVHYQQQLVQHGVVLTDLHPNGFGHHLCTGNKFQCGWVGD